MNDEIRALSIALDKLRERLMNTPRSSPGFGEMRILYRELTLALIDAADKADSELAKEINEASRKVSEEWESNKDKFAEWHSVLKPVVNAVGLILGGASLSNPLLLLL